MNEIKEINVWVVVKVESGVTTEVGVYPNHGLASLASKEMRSNISEESDDLQTFGPYNISLNAIAAPDL